MRPVWLAGAVLLVVSAGCGTRGGEAAKSVGTEVVTGLTSGLPGLNWGARVAGVAERLGRLEALIEAESFSERLLFPGSEPCRALLREGTEVRFSRSGPYGQIRTDEHRCAATGSFALEQMRARGGKSGGLSGPARPRTQATYRVQDEDEEFVALRGRFPLVSRLGAPGGEDIVVWIPNAEPCRELADRTEASLEYRSQRAPLVLLTSGGGECAIAAVTSPQ